MDSFFKIQGRYWFWYIFLSSTALIVTPLFYVNYFLQSVPVFDREGVMPGSFAIFGGPFIALVLTVVFLCVGLKKQKENRTLFLPIFAVWSGFLLFVILGIVTYCFYYSATIAGGAFLISPGGIVGTFVVAAGIFALVQLSLFLIARGEEFFLPAQKTGEQKRKNNLPFILGAVVVLAIGGASVIFAGDPFFLFVLFFMPIMLFFGPVFVTLQTAIILSMALFVVLAFFAYLNWYILKGEDRNWYLQFKYLRSHILLCVLFFWYVHFVVLTFLFPLRISGSFFFM